MSPKSLWRAWTTSRFRQRQFDFSLSISTRFRNLELIMLLLNISIRGVFWLCRWLFVLTQRDRMSWGKLSLSHKSKPRCFERVLHAMQIFITLHAMQTYITFVLVSAIFSGILSFSEYFELRPAVYIEPVLADTPSFTEAINLCSSWNKKVTHLNGLPSHRFWYLTWSRSSLTVLLVF